MGTAAFLIPFFFIPGKLKLPCLFIIFFLTGMLLDLEQHRPSELLSLAQQKKKTTLEGTILDPVKVTDEMARLNVNVHKIFAGKQVLSLNENIMVSVYRHTPALSPGDKIRFPARLRAFRNFNNPGGFDYESAMKLKGFTCAASISDGRSIVPMGPGHLPIHHKLMVHIQGPIRNFFKENLNPEDCALFRALILGERQGITHTLREPFNRTGLGHVLAVSGLHIGLVAWIAFMLFKWCLSRPYTLPLRFDIKKATALLTCLPVMGYVFIAGFQVSSQRAMIMVLVYLMSLILGREKEIWSTLALAGLLILAVDPHALFSMSFQLSFSAVIGILWLTPAILDKIPAPDDTAQKTILTRLYAYFTGLAAVCIAATIFLLPIVVCFFHRITLVTIPANLMVVPMLGLWVIPLGLLSVMALPVSTSLADILLQMGAWGLNIMMDITRFWSEIPWSSLWTVTPNGFEMVLYYALLLSVFFFRQRPWVKVGFFVVIALLLVDAGYWINRVHFNKALRVSFLDVGQANAALVEFPGGGKMMIDGGGFPRGSFDVGRMVVAPFLWHSKIRQIDYLVLSHPQSDHMNGLRFMARAFSPKEFWYNGNSVKTRSFRELMDIVDDKKIKVLLPRDLKNGRQINGANIEILHPKKEQQALPAFYSSAALNNNPWWSKLHIAADPFCSPET